MMSQENHSQWSELAGAARCMHAPNNCLIFSHLVERRYGFGPLYLRSICVTFADAWYIPNPKIINVTRVNVRQITTAIDSSVRTNPECMCSSGTLFANMPSLNA